MTCCLNIYGPVRQDNGERRLGAEPWQMPGEEADRPSREALRGTVDWGFVFWDVGTGGTADMSQGFPCVLCFVTGFS